MKMSSMRYALIAAVVVLVAACHGKPKVQPVTPTAEAVPPPPAPRPAPPAPVAEPIPVPPEPAREDAVSASSLDDLNRNSPLRPAFFALDSAEIDPTAK